MKAIYKTASFSALALTIVPSMLVFSGAIDNSTNKWLMLTGFVLWFVSAPAWIGKDKA